MVRDDTSRLGFRADQRTPVFQQAVKFLEGVQSIRWRLCATLALQLEGKPAVSFSFNLNGEVIAYAKDSPTGFLDPLKRSFDNAMAKNVATTRDFSIAGSNQRILSQTAFLLRAASGRPPRQSKAPAVNVITFRMRRLDGVTLENRLTYQDQQFKIMSIKEIGRRVGLDI